MERPKLAAIPGIETFAGHSFHTGRWDYGYIGGDPAGGLVGLAGKAVGIIGTGATAAQSIPHLAEGARRLTVFQRAPSPIHRCDDDVLDLAAIEALGQGWQRRPWGNLTTIVSGLSTAEEDLIRDGWTSIITNIRALAERKAGRGEAVDNPMTLAPLADFVGMEGIRDRVEDVVEDAAAEEAWCAENDRIAINQEAFMRECTPSYFNFEGDLKRRNVRNSQYGGGPIAFYRILADWRAEGTMPGLELGYRAAAALAGAAAGTPPRPIVSADVTA